MAFRIIEISHDAELHIKNGQLEITQGGRNISYSHRRYWADYDDWTQYTAFYHGFVDIEWKQSGFDDTGSERYSLAGVLYNACIVNGTKINILTAITEMCESLKCIIYDNSDEQLKLPAILPIERIDGVTEWEYLW